MRKKIWKILPLVTGLVLLTASSALTVHGESDNTIDVTLFEYYGAAEPPVRCGESHLSGLTEPPHFVY